MSDLSIEDLKADMEEQNDSAEDSGGGEWISDLVDKLDDRGYLDPLIQHSLGVDGSPTTGASNVEPVETDGGGESSGISAGDVSKFGTMVIDSVGDVPMSQVVKFAEDNPEQVNQLIEQAMEK